MLKIFKKKCAVFEIQLWSVQNHCSIINNTPNLFQICNTMFKTL